MIENNICLKCNHVFVCNKLSHLARFDAENKKYVGIDVRLIRCLDFDLVEDDCDGEQDRSEI